MTGIAFGTAVGLGYVAVLTTGLEAAVSLGKASGRADVVVKWAGALANAAVAPMSTPRARDVVVVRPRVLANVVATGIGIKEAIGISNR